MNTNVKKALLAEFYFPLHFLALLSIQVKATQIFTTSINTANVVMNK